MSKGKKVLVIGSFVLAIACSASYRLVMPGAVFLMRFMDKNTETKALVSVFIKHVELEEDEEDSTSMISYFLIIRFWTELLRN